MVELEKKGLLSPYKRNKLHNALFLKFCHCIRKVDATSTVKFTKERNPYALCRYAVYNNRNITPNMKFKGKKLKT